MIHEVIGIAGDFGLGKTTIANRLAQAIEPQSDTVSVGATTSGIDSVTGGTLLANLGGLADRRTLCIVSHCAEALRGCDRLFAFATGHLVDDASQTERLGVGASYVADDNEGAR